MSENSSIFKINIYKVNWYFLSGNPNAIYIERNLDKVKWITFSGNLNAIHILEQNLNKINWDELSQNPYIIEFNRTATKFAINIFASLLKNNTPNTNYFIYYKNPKYKGALIIIIHVILYFYKCYSARKN